MPQRLRYVIESIWERPLFAGSYPSWPAWLGGIAAAAWFSTPDAIRNFIVLMGLDYLSGVIAALWVLHSFDSLEARRGLARKSLMLLVVLACGRMAGPLHVDQQFASVIANAFSVTELVSIVENAARAGAPVPGPLLALLARAKKVVGQQPDQPEQGKGAAAS